MVPDDCECPMESECRGYCDDAGIVCNWRDEAHRLRLLLAHIVGNLPRLLTGEPPHPVHGGHGGCSICDDAVQAVRDLLPTSQV